MGSPAQRETAPEPLILNDSERFAAFTERVAKLIEEDIPTPFAELRRQLERTSCKLDLPPPDRRRMTPDEIYRRRADTVLLIGVFYHCASPTCGRWHVSYSTGVLLREDGVFATNYHVVDSPEPKAAALGAMTLDGRAFLVEEVLAADRAQDVAILRLRGARGLSFAPIERDEPVGRPVTLITHPKSRFYTLSQGWISRYSVDASRRLVMTVTADYAVGSSGGPVFNDRGNIVGIASRTETVAPVTIPLLVDSKTKALSAAGPGDKPSLIGGRSAALALQPQMTAKDAVPSRAILNLVEASPRR